MNYMKHAVIYIKPAVVCIKRAVVVVLGLLIFAICTPQAFAQYKASGGLDHVEIGVFGELFRINQTDTNLAGVGARLSVNVLPLLQFEAETAYDFNQVFTETDPTGAFIQRTNMRAIHGLFGPKLQTNKGPVRLFLTAKGGAVGFHLDQGPATIGQFFSNVSSIRSQNVSGVFYPGGDAEAFLGPIGFRLDVGDEIYFNDSAHHNLRVTFGPTIRF
jgi:hypothetical protein